MWGNLFEVLDEPVQSGKIQTFSVGLTSVGIENGVVIKMFTEPEFILLLGIENVSEQLENIESGLRLERLEGGFINSKSSQDNLGFSLLGLLDGELHLQTWGEWVEVSGECLIPVNSPEPGIKSGLEEKTSQIIINLRIKIK